MVGGMFGNKRVFWLIAFLISSIAVSAQSYLPLNIFSVSEDLKLAKIELNEHFDASKDIPLDINAPITSFGISANGNLLNNRGYVRFILIGNDFKEYLAYEVAYPFYDSHFVLDNACDETCYLEGVIPASLRIEIQDATLNLDEIVSSEEMPKVIKEELREAQQTEKIEALNNIITEKDLGWIAGETSVSRLSYPEKKKLFGGELPNLYGFEYYTGGIFRLPSGDSGTAGSSLGNSSTPVTWDWRNTHGENWITPIRYQVGATCWCYCAVAAVEAGINLYYNQHLNIDLSEQDSVCRHPGSCGGGSPSWTMSEFRDYGLVDDACFPTVSPCDDTCESLEKCTDWEDRLWFIESYAWPAKDDDNLKRTVIEQGPITFGIVSWWHCMTLVGYNKIKEGDFIYNDYHDNPITIPPGHPLIGETYWILKNSWGTGWGENGYGRVVVNNNSDRYLIDSMEGPYFVNKPLYEINCVDKDNDGYCNWGISDNKSTCLITCNEESDCDDSNSNSFYFGAVEICDDGYDNNCNGLIDKNDPECYYECGDNITQDAILTSDILNCAGHGLVIGANSITLDCNQHFIDGNLAGEYSGIFLNNKSNVTINNCNLKEFNYGIYLSSNSDNNLISSNHLIGNGYGAYLDNSQYNTFWDNTFINNIVNAYESAASNNNNWNYTTIGNYWSDFQSNPGFPDYYEISGPGDGIDYFPDGPINFGTLESYLITPTSDVTVSQNEFFNFSSGVNCAGGYCGNVSATLDPEETENYDACIWEYSPGNCNSVPGNGVCDHNYGCYNPIGTRTSDPFIIEDATEIVSIVYKFYMTECSSVNPVYEFRLNDIPVAASDPMPGLCTCTGTPGEWPLTVTASNTALLNSVFQFGEENNLSIYNSDGYACAAWLEANITYSTGKGIVSTVIGTEPFYTIDQNPFNCGIMEDGDSCNQTWTVNATGEHLSNWTFFTIYESNYEEVYNETEKINVQIIGNYVPEINNVECEENNSQWVDCSNILYDDQLTRVRVNCTDRDGTITTASFTLTNIPDNNILFDDTAVQDGDYWVYDNSDILIEDSGNWELFVQCGDNENSYTNTSIEWFIPFGVLQSYLINPTTDIDVNQYEFFNFTSGVRCIDGECGNVTAGLDPPPDTEFITGAIPTTTSMSNCIPFGQGNGYWGTYKGFVYKNIEAFNLNNGDYICFDLGAENDYGISMDIWLCHTSVNGETTCDDDGYTQIVYDQVALPNPKGDNSCYTWELCFPISTSYSFPGEGLVVKFKATGAFSSDSTCTQVLCHTNSADPSNKFVQRWYYDGSSTSTSYIGGVAFYKGADKGVIPMFSGTPFYTIDQNPFNCGIMKSGDSCNQTWTVNATGEHLSNWTFFTIYESNYEEVYNKTEKINVQIIGNYEPFITSIECQENNSLWTGCSDIMYNDYLTSVRVNCTDVDGNIANVNIKLENIPDNNIFFDNLAVQDGDYWIYDNDDILIQDSGDFKLSVTCTDNENAEINQIVEWFVPFGLLQSYLINPTTDIDVDQYEFFNFSSGVNCVDGECGNVTATLDPEESANTKEIKKYEKEILEKIVPDKCPEERLKEINTKIKEKNAKWQAGLTPKALLSVEEKRVLLGSFIIPEDEVNIPTIYIETKGLSQPPYFDWRNKDGGDWTAPVKDQGSCGSCWAFSAVGTVDAAFNINNNNPNLDLDLSEQQLVSNNGVCCGTCGDCNGGWMSTALGYIRDTGIADEECFPYTATTATCNLCTDWQDRKHHITDYFKVTPATKEAYKQALMEYGPLSIGIDSSDMFAYYVGGIYEELEEIDFTGLNHGIVLIGWNDTGGYWIIKNSWGTGWGENGYGKMIYGDVEKYNYVHAVEGTELFGKGVIPMFNGTPFYTIDQNPTICTDMKAGDSCEKTWTVNATGEGFSSWDFFTIYTPYYAMVTESTTDKINITIIGNYEPFITSIECQENNSLWTNCSDIMYNDHLTSVRVNCTDVDGNIASANIKLENIPDNNIFFDNLAVQDGDYWIYDNDDILIQDSGDFKLSVTCTDNENAEINQIVEWFIPFGLLQSYLINPTTDIDVDQYEFFEFSSGVSCVGGECGNVSATLDPETTIFFDDMESGINGWAFNGFWHLVNDTSPYPNSYSPVHSWWYGQDATGNYDNGSTNLGWLVSPPIDLNRAVTANLTFWYWYETETTGTYYDQRWVYIYLNDSWQTLQQLSGDTMNVWNFKTINLTPYTNNEIQIAFYFNTVDSLYNTYRGWYIDDVKIVGSARKGTIPMFNGTPFYTIDQNPFNCGIMENGDSCEKTWTVNATGELNSSYEFFTIYKPLQYPIAQAETAKVNVTIVEKLIESFSKDLVQGWNLISIPLILENSTINYIFKDINYEKIFSYINNKYIELKNNDEINNTIGLWVKMNVDDTLIVEGLEPSNTLINLNEGSNLISYPSLTEQNVDIVFNGINNSLNNVYNYENNNWHSYNPIKQNNSLKIMKPGFGYWVNVNESVTLEIS